MAEEGEIIVFGATGYTGRLVVAELVRRGLPFAIAGRSAERLDALRAAAGLPPAIRSVVADPTRPDTLPALFGPPRDGSRPILINCIGPFTRFGEPVVQAAITAGAHYLDISGEQRYIAHIIDRYHAKAIEAGVTVVPACGVEYALTNWAAAQAARGLEPLVSIVTGTQASKIQPTRGTQLSALEAISTPGLGYRNGRRIVRLVGSRSRNIPFPDGSRRATLAPFGEIVTLPRHIDVQTIESYVAVPAAIATGLPFVALLLPVVGDFAGFALGPVIRRRPEGPDATQRQAERWAMVAIATGPQGRRVVSLAGRDVYGLTAIILAYCAERLRRGEMTKSGTLGPAHAFDAAAALAFLQREAGVTMTTEPPQTLG